jgi:hypothetical protein
MRQKKYKLYLSGNVFERDYENLCKKFNSYENLHDNFYEVIINPMRIYKKNWSKKRKIMCNLYNLIIKSNSISMLPGYQFSKLCKLELKISKILKYKIIINF